MIYELKRRPKTLSYSAFAMFQKDPDEYFRKYLAEYRAPRLPQENYMSVGSAFDAYVKAELHAAIFGPGADPAYEFEALFVEQVEEHNRDWARGVGLHVLESYKQSGSYDELLALLLQSTEPPRFETTVEGLVDGVPFMGKPDLRFMVKLRDTLVRIILDWKVKGYCSKYGASPSQGYMLCRDGFDAIKLGIGKTKACPEGKQSKSHGTEHDKYLAYDHHGLTINAGYMETCSLDYADQVSLYGWMLGETPGDENTVVWIDEIVAKFMGEGKQPLLRVANHRARVGKEHQLSLLAKVRRCWDAIESGHVFLDLSRADSDARCEALEMESIGLQSDGSAEEDWFNEVSRPQFKR